MTRTLWLAAITAVFFSACSKDDTAEPATTPGGTGGGGIVSYTFAQADARLFAGRSIQMIGGIASPSFLGFASFEDVNNQGVDVGLVQLNGTELNDTLYFDGSPFWLGTGNYATQETSGLDLNGQNLDWSITGGNGFQAFNQTISNITFPVADTVNSSSTVDKSLGYVLSCATISGADSVNFSVGYAATKTVAGNALSCVFTAGDLASTPTGYQTVSIEAYKHTGRNIGGKNVLFVKSQRVSRSVQVID